MNRWARGLGLLAVALVVLRVTPLAQAMKQVAISGPLASTMATRSLRPMPNAFS